MPLILLKKRTAEWINSVLPADKKETFKKIMAAGHYNLKNDKDIITVVSLLNNE